MKAPKAECHKCPLKNKPFVPSKIVPGSDVLVIGQSPAKEEIRKKEPFVGMSGQLLDYMIQESIDEVPEYSKTNAVLCACPKHHLLQATKCCAPRLKHEIETFEGETILATGLSAHQSIQYSNGERLEKTLSEVQGYWKKLWGKQILTTYLTAFVLRKPSMFYVVQHDVRRAFSGRYDGRLSKPPELEFATCANDIQVFFDNIPPGSDVVFDFETENLRWFDDSRILMCGFTVNYETCLIVPGSLFYETFCPESHPRFLNVFFQDEIRFLKRECKQNYGKVEHDLIFKNCHETLKKNMERKDFNWVAHNGKYDCLVASSVGINVYLNDDTLLQHFNLWEYKGTHSLKLLARLYFDVQDYEKKLVARYIKKSDVQYSKVPFMPLAVYCAWDNTLTLGLFHVFKKELEEENLTELYRNFSMRQHHALLEMEWQGVKIDVPYLKKYDLWFLERLKKLKQRLQQHMKEAAREKGYVLKGKLRNYNPNSWQQNSEVWYDIFEFPLVSGPKVKLRSTNKDALQLILRAKPHLEKLPYLTDYKEYKRVAKLHSTYIKGLLRHISPKGRIHTNFMIFGTEVYRIATDNPNLQNIPRPYEDIYGNIIRSAFIAGEGKLFVDVDLSQAELRAAAILSNDPVMIDSFNREDADPHSDVALAAFGEGFSKEQRTTAKSANFMSIYGGGLTVFLSKFDIPYDVGKHLLDTQKKEWKVFFNWKKEQFKIAEKQGYTISALGRVRRFPLFTPDTLHEIEKATGHSPVASVASDLTQLAMCQLVEEGYHLVLTVHDSLIDEVYEEDAEETKDYIAKVMQETCEKHFPGIRWGVDGQIKQRWAPFPILLPKEEFERVSKLVDHDPKYEPLRLKRKHYDDLFLDKIFEQHMEVQFWTEKL